MAPSNGRMSTVVPASTRAASCASTMKQFASLRLLSDAELCEPAGATRQTPLASRAARPRRYSVRPARLLIGASQTAG